MTENNKRKHRRYEVRLDIHAAADTVRVYGKTKNVSLGGAFIQSCAPLEPGTRCRLMIEINGVVIRKMKGGMAIQFEDPLKLQ